MTMRFHGRSRVSSEAIESLDAFALMPDVKIEAVTFRVKTGSHLIVTQHERNTTVPIKVEVHEVRTSE